VVGVALTMLLVPFTQGESLKPGPVGKDSKKEASAENLFTNAQLLRIQLEIPEAGMQALRETRMNAWQGSTEKRPVVKCTVREADRVYTDVAVHLKGAAGSFRGSTTSHPSRCILINTSRARDFMG